MVIFTPTIPHTGTHLLRRDILKCFNRVNIGEYRVVKDKPGLWQIGIHILDNTIDEIESLMSTGIPTFIPMRHPARVVASHRSRKVHRKDAIDTVSNGFRLFKRLLKYDPYIIHIDTKDRDSRLEHISGIANIILKSEWSVSEQHGCHHGNHAFELTLDTVNELPNDVLNIYCSLEGFCKLEV